METFTSRSILAEGCVYECRGVSQGGQVWKKKSDDRPEGRQNPEGLPHMNDLTGS